MKTKTFLLLSVLILALTACKTQENPSPDQVSVQLKWIHQAQFAGFYAAETQGYYADENLAVTFVPGGVGVDIFEGVTNGDVQFSVVGADSLIAKRAEGLPVTAIASIYRVNPFLLVAFTDSGITSPRDFVGHTVALSLGYDEAQFQAMLNTLNIDSSLINIVPYTYDNAPFLEGEVDVTVSFAAGSLITLYETTGDRSLTLIWPGDYGVHFYSDTIIVNEAYLDSNPDLILRFLRASLKGHRYAIENPEAAIDATLQYAEIQDRDLQTAMFEASIPLIHTGEDHIGWMRPEVWDEMHDTLLTQGFIQEPLDLEKVYTLEFLERIYEDGS